MGMYITNMSCDMCDNYDKILNELKIGNKKLHLCDKCTMRLAKDLYDFTNDNLVDNVPVEEWDN